MKRLEAKRLAAAVEQRKQRELMKANETPEEKRARRMKEKASKEQKRRERMGWDKEYQHYTNDDNPFGDSHLTSSFVWSKKLEKQGYKNVTTEEIEALNRQKQWENKAELEKVKKRRQERELERQQREDEANMMQRHREAAQFDEWERQEDQFHLEQARLRSKIRIQDGRAKPIDLLAQYISYDQQQENLEETIEMQMHEPYTYLSGLGLRDLEDLLVDIRVYQELEKDHYTDYWADLTIIVHDEVHKLRKLSAEEQQQQLDEQDVASGRREGIHQSVARDVGDVFKGKTTQQLEELRRKIEGKIEGHSDGVDVGYWESLLSQLKAHMAKSRLRDRHQEGLRKKLDLLRQEQQVGSPTMVVKKEENMMEADDPQPGPSVVREETERGLDEEVEKADEEEENGNAEDDLLTESFRQYTLGNYSPKYVAVSSVEAGIKLLAEAEDEGRLERMRQKVMGAADEEEEAVRPPTALEVRMRKEAQKGMDENEVQFSVETNLDTEVYLWSDKYRPRKPRYFNRVHTGFEWNKYNQTHYDMDNPPPKIVQGYKFNIFYPDLIDKNRTPQYTLTACSDNKDFGTLRFSAGPPYEDIAFKIVNREWEYSYKRGFRCQFQNNIFQLWFHFKRYRYRR